MDGASIVQIISSLGFPIAMCLLFFWYMTKSNETHHEEIKEIQSQHKEETNQLAEAINNNTLVMQKLLDRMGVEK